MDKLYIIIPAYNEEANIKQIIEEWYPIVEQYNGGGESRLVIIDDGSKDSTYEIMKNCGEDRPLFVPITKPNGGHGATLFYGYQYALKHGADYIFQTDSDGQTLPSEFGEFWESRKEHDAVIGYRNQRKDGFSRIVVTKTLKFVLRIIFGVKVTDANTPYRIMKREVLEKYIKDVPDNFNLTNVLLTVFFIKGKQRVKFIPITFRPRQGGVNSINLRRITKIGIQALKDFKQINTIWKEKNERA